ncbi:uncharacterized protein LOC131323584 [Rhododendron vialii]|uniref:uncharacterized protein LOC131323584 n=1 Tax=Rhododendron vialii TaxID=182163 RepID=UPI00265F60B2|nr:uncharacterized protein LOC131323584 [Rhododendron vialii]
MASSSNQNMGALPLSFLLLNGESYDFWCVKMKTQLMSNDVWEYAQDGFEDYQGVEVALSNEQKKQLKVDNRMNAKALSMIQQGISDNLFPRIINETQAKKAWDILYNEHRGNLKVKTIKLQSLRRDYENFKMKDSELLNDYFSRLMDVVNQMKTYGEDVATQKIVEKILINLPKKFDPIVAIIENTQDLANLSVKELMGSLKTFEQRLNRQSEKSIESAFQSKLNDCRVTNNQQANYFEEQEGGGCMFYACQAASEQKNDVWFLDSGCSNHMTGDESIFVKIDTSSNSQVKMGNGALVQAKENGTIAVETKKGTRNI